MLEDTWVRFEIPFVLRINNDLTARPSIQSGIKFPEDIEQSEPEYIYHLVILHEKNTNLLKNFLEDIDRKLSFLLTTGKVDFLEHSLRYSLKGFLSEGVEQFLWHFVALESLLGKEKKYILELLSDRLAAILGKDEEEKQYIREKFKDIYELRCDLVHGNFQHAKKIYGNHLRNVREFNRLSILWFINYLYYINKEITENKLKNKFSKKNKILDALFLGVKDETYNEIKLKISNFPFNKEWIQ